MSSPPPPVQPEARKRKAEVPVDCARAERAVWMVRLPSYVAQQWQALPLLQERQLARSRAEPALAAVLVPALRALHTRNQLAADWDDAARGPAFTALLDELAAGRIVTLTPAGTGASRDLVAGCLAPLRACVGAETRVALAQAGRPRTQRLSDDAVAALVPSGVAFAHTALAACAQMLAALPPDQLRDTLASNDAMQVLVSDAARSICGALVPVARIASGAVAQDLVPCAEAPQGEPLVGRVRMSFDPVAVPAAGAEFTLTLCGASAEGLPRDFSLRRTADNTAAHAFGEPAATACGLGGAGGGYQPLAGLPPGGVLSAEGVVERRLDAHLSDAGDAEYRRLSRQRSSAANTKTRVTRTVAQFAYVAAPGAGRDAARRADTMEAAPQLVPLPRRANVDPKKGKPGGGAAAPELDPDALQALLFSKFERRSHWKIAELVAATQQPLAKLKLGLAAIAEMDRAPGPLRGQYQLQPHLRRPEE